MLFPRLPLAVMCIVMVYACSKKAKNQTVGEYYAAVLSADAVPETKTLPTRPDGGAVAGKSQVLDPEMAETRRNQNIVQPIIMGTNVAGITMATPQSKAMNTLVYYTSSNGFDFFSEHIAIFWGAGTDPLPQQLVIQEGYAGKLKLPAPYSDISVGQNMDGTLTTLDELKQFMLVLGAAFENQPIATYNCITSLTCEFNQSDDFFMLDFRRGGIYLTKAVGLPVGLIYFTQPQKFYAPLTDPIIHNVGIGGLTFQTKRATAEVKIGSTIQEQFETDASILFSYYDHFNFAVNWGTDTTPTLMKAMGAYAGSENFGGTIGTHKLGDSFAAYTTAADDGTNLMLVLDRALNNRAANYNCSTATATVAATCSNTLQNAATAPLKRSAIVIDRTVYTFSNDATRTWLSVGMREP